MLCNFFCNSVQVCIKSSDETSEAVVESSLRLARAWQLKTCSIFLSSSELVDKLKGPPDLSTIIYTLHGLLDFNNWSCHIEAGGMVWNDLCFIGITVA